MDPRDAGSNPAKVMDFKKNLKIRSTPSFGWEV
jgi:hypothetical protein